MKLAVCVATMKTDVPLIMEWIDRAAVLPELFVRWNTPEENLGISKSCEWLYRLAERSEWDVLCVLHDDVSAHEIGWDQRILKEFEDSRVGLVGMGGAVRHGHPDLYKRPYVLQDLARHGYCSGTTDAESHGERFTGSRSVAVLDGFAMCFSRQFLERINGFTSLIENNIDYLCYDYWVSALARRHGYTIRMVGISCCHHGGGTAVKLLPIDRSQEYDYSHRRFYDEFRDCMPYEAN